MTPDEFKRLCLGLDELNSKAWEFHPEELPEGVRITAFGVEEPLGGGEGGAFRTQIAVAMLATAPEVMAWARGFIASIESQG